MSLKQQPKYEPVATQGADDSDPFVLGSSNTTESLTRPSSVPTATSTALMQVTAPATLPEGYVFETSLGERLVQVTVPPGGVEQGQVFTVPLPSDVESVVHNKIQIPVGHWRDGLFCGNLCNYGICHPHCWTACCCTTIGTAQVIRRFGLQWNGLSGTAQQASIAYPILLSLVCLYYCVRLGLWLLLIYIDPERTLDDPEDHPEWEDTPPSKAWIEVDDFYVLWFWSFWIFLAVILYNTRSHVRNRYGIPAEFPHADACLSFCCPCYTVGQLLRHSTEYNIYPANVCSDRGIAAHAPEIV